MKFQLLKMLITIVILTAISTIARASHIYGGRLTYAWISDSTYKITLTLYTNCGPESSSANSLLSSMSPALCIMDGNSLVDTKPLLFNSSVSGTELFNACVPPLTSQCQDINSPVPGVRKYSYSLDYTLPHRSTKWRFVHGGSVYPGSANYIAYITSLTTPYLTGAQMIYYESRLGLAQNSSPVITGGEQPYYCVNNAGTYTISATDPDGDSLYFELNPARVITNYSYGSEPLCRQDTVSGIYTYPSTPNRPVVSSIFSYNHSTGEVEFVPTQQQRAMITYTIYEYRAGVLVGTTQHNMTLTVLNCSDICTAGISDPEREDVTLYPNPAHDELTINCTHNTYNNATLTDITGKTISSTALHNRQQTIDIKGLASGIYYVILKGDNGTAVKRITIAP
jgi:hypothetical protein